MNYAVYNTDEEHLGEIKEIMIDTIDAAVAYALGPGGPRPVPSHPIPPAEDPRVTEPRPEPITELPDHPPSKDPPEETPQPSKRL